ncbi:MAG: hypothetical protein HY242_07775 [Afipia sp.]|nr:hypothetical protein [Afipia sp.]
MASVSNAFPNLAPSIEDQVLNRITDDECVSRLARAVEEHDDQRLQEVALLIGRLAVPIE